jgi:hydroxymethylpyrimidine/phosphomethylpyrimidine kinase
LKLDAEETRVRETLALGCKAVLIRGGHGTGPVHHFYAFY